MTIVSNVDEADVYVDNEMVGKVRDYKFTLDLKPGKHLVELRKEKYAAGSKEVSISAGEVKEERFELSRSVFSVAVRVEPSDAKVYATSTKTGKLSTSGTSATTSPLSSTPSTFITLLPGFTFALNFPSLRHQ